MDDIKEQQDTGNHDNDGADRFGGTRAGADNVEPTTIDKGTDVDKVAPLEQQRRAADDARSAEGPTLRQAERDERGRI